MTRAAEQLTRYVVALAVCAVFLLSIGYMLERWGAIVAAIAIVGAFVTVLYLLITALRPTNK